MTRSFSIFDIPGPGRYVSAPRPLEWYASLSAGQMSIRIIFTDGVFKNQIVFIFYKYMLFMDKIAVFLTFELLELIFHGNCWKNPQFEVFKLVK